MKRENISKVISIEKDLVWYEDRVKILKGRVKYESLLIIFNSKSSPNNDARKHEFTSVLGKEFDQFIIDQTINCYEGKIIELKAELLRLE